MYKYFFKHFLDFFISLIVLILLSPFLIIITIWLHFANKGAGAFFFQERPGYKEAVFKVIKFKSMTDERDANGNLLLDSQRITNFGKFVRKTSLDELPQLINVLKGDMSLIGPRPLLPEYLPFYTSKEKKRHDVRPGITGWAQVNGRNSVKWNQRLNYDIYYVEHLTFYFDLKIIIQSVKNVLLRKNVIVVPNGIPLNIERRKKLKK
jgi:lipopolysaccharide/colanic/teichoic acid biosynthesis glycosyltransferase